MNYRLFHNKQSLIATKQYLEGVTQDVESSIGSQRHRLTRKKKEEMALVLRQQIYLLDNVLTNNGLRVYELQIPPHIGGSVGDMEQFIVKLDPLE